MNLTSEKIQSYVRIALYFVAGNFVQRGYISASALEMIVGLVGGLAVFGWTLWGSRLEAKLAELAKYQEVKKVEVKDPEIAEAVPSPKVQAP